MSGAEQRHLVRIVAAGPRVLAVCSACNPEIITDGPTMNWAMAAAKRHAQQTGGVIVDPRSVIAER